MLHALITVMDVEHVISMQGIIASDFFLYCHDLFTVLNHLTSINLSSSLGYTKPFPPRSASELQTSLHSRTQQSIDEKFINFQQCTQKTACQEHL